MNAGASAWAMLVAAVFNGAGPGIPIPTAT
jgi:hypothetical protein